METRIATPLGLLALISLLWLTTIAKPAMSATATHSQVSALASRLVNQVVQAKQGQVYEVVSSPQNLELLEDVWADLHKVGAWSVVRLVSDRMTRLYYQEVPTRFDAEPQASALGLYQFISGEINIDYESDPGLFDNVPPSRLTAQQQANNVSTKDMLARSIPFIEVGNGLYPSKYTAEQFGITLSQLSGLFWNGVNADPAAIQSTGELIKSSLGSGSIVHITAPNGTDVTFRSAEHTVVINDGTISAAARKKGGAALNVSLPAGDVTLVPIAGSAKGTVVFGPVYVNSTKVKGLTFHLAGGKLTSWTASSGRDVVDGYYKTGGTGKDDFTFADIGANPNIHYIEGTALNASMASGMVSLGVGNNLSIGGTNSSLFSAGGYVPDATVTIGGKTVVSGGRFVSGAHVRAP